MGRLEKRDYYRAISYYKICTHSESHNDSHTHADNAARKDKCKSLVNIKPYHRVGSQPNCS